MNEPVNEKPKTVVAEADTVNQRYSFHELEAGVYEKNLWLAFGTGNMNKIALVDKNEGDNIPFVENRYEVEVFNDEHENINIYSINNFVKMQCDIYIDKIWKYNDVFYCKWKARKLYLV